MTINKIIILLIIVSSLIACSKNKVNTKTQFFPKTEQKVEKIPNKDNVWVFILAGQSNMAGRAFVEPQDTIPNERVLTINIKGELIIAKEPLHFYEPTIKGLDCGLAFGKEMIKQIPDSITVLLIPTAIGGSSIRKWLGDSIHRNVPLLTNFRQKVALAKNFGQIKGILWHQGERDAHENNILEYQQKLTELFFKFRELTDENLPIVIGELGSFSKENERWDQLNNQIRNYTSTDSNALLIKTSDLKDRGDKLHFDSESQRILGQRFANAYLKKYPKKSSL